MRAQWAGDSRVYLLTVESGLQQVSTDDVEEPDPMEQLRGDFRLQNLLSASADFEINERTITVGKQALVLVATDGLFHYLPTPGTLEYVLLNSMRDSESETSRVLSNQARKSSHDDVSFVLIALGFERFSEIPLAFRRRKSLLNSMGYANLLASLPGEEATIAAADRLWGLEKMHYTELMIRR